MAGILVDAYGPRFGLGTGLAGALCAATAVPVRATAIGRNVDLLPQTPRGPPAPAWNDDPVPGHIQTPRYKSPGLPTQPSGTR